MNKQLVAAAVSAAIYSFAPAAHATNGDQMIGVTAIQWGMAGAVVAAPQDAGTIMSNPAGLAELGMKDVRFDMGFGLLNPPRKANGFESDSDYYLIPSGAVAFNVNDRLYLGMGMAGLSGMGSISPIRRRHPAIRPLSPPSSSTRSPPASATRSATNCLLAPRSTSITRAWRCPIRSTPCRRTRCTASGRPRA